MAGRGIAPAHGPEHARGRSGTKGQGAARRRALPPGGPGRYGQAEALVRTRRRSGERRDARTLRSTCRRGKRIGEVSSKNRAIRQPIVRQIVARFAPRPTGLPHQGHAFSALTACQAAREAGGRFLLRIEDIAPGRCRPEYAQTLMEDLRWLGLRREETVRFDAHARRGENIGGPYNNQQEQQEQRHPRG
nr:glutamate--tRNA ligase family protein [Solidesulfovibrio sp.]